MMKLNEDVSTQHDLRELYWRTNSAVVPSTGASDGTNVSSTIRLRSINGRPLITYVYTQKLCSDSMNSAEKCTCG